MSETVDVAVVGAGLMGSATAWAAAHRGLSVVVLEQFTVGHLHGSSHGSARIVRRAYLDAMYTQLTGRAFELWRELEQETQARLLRTLGGLDHGPRRTELVAARLQEAGVAHEVLDAGEAEARWPGMRFAGRVVFHPQAGVLDAAAAVRSFFDSACRKGAQLRESAVVSGLSPSMDGCLVSFSDGSRLSARCVVVAAGGWVSSLLDGIIELPALTVTQQQLFHFPRVDPAQPPWPSVIHQEAREIYHLAGGRDGGPGDARKVGEHGGGIPVTPAEGRQPLDPNMRSRLIKYVRDWLPGLRPSPQDESTCLYTTTPSEDFIIDRQGSIVVCSPCSGHGAKFAPLIGELVTGLVTGDGTVPDRFRLTSHATAGAGKVSL